MVEIKYIKNKFFLILITVVLAVTVFCTTLSIMGVGSVVVDGANAVTFPFRWCFRKIGDGISGIGKYFTSVDKLAERNAELESRVAELEAQLRDRDFSEEENRELRKYLNIKETGQEFEYLDARVVSYSSQNYRSLLTLDRGSADGITTGMPVTDENGVVGRVCEVALYSCKVITVTDASTSLGVYIPRTGDAGIVTGSFGGSGEAVIEGRQFDEKSDIKIGDIVCTDGNGSIYPRGLQVGTVSEVKRDNYSRTYTVIIKPVADFENPGTVTIITRTDKENDKTEKGKEEIRSD